MVSITPPNPPAGSARSMGLVDELVFEALELLETGGPKAVEELIARHKQLEGPLRERLDALARAGLLGAGEKLPQAIGEFKILRCLGEGGMGVVYLAEQTSLQRRVALKLVRPEFVYFPGARERFQREVTAAARLSHPGVVQVYSVGEADGLPYFAMEAVAGCSLAQALEALRGRRPEELSGADLYAQVCRVTGIEPEATLPDLFAGSWPQVATRVAFAIANALEHAHERGVLHRDVKPGNTMLTPEGRVVLLDFGLASLSGSNRLTRTGSTLGSLPYMAPEVLGGSAAAGPQSDVWSAGITYYELLTLGLPFEAPSDLELKSAIDTGRMLAPKSRNSGLPWDVETVCLKALEHDLARRYPSAAEFAADLRAVLELRPIAAKRPGPWRQLRAMARRHPGYSAGLLALLITLVVAPLVYARVQQQAKVKIQSANELTQAANRNLEAANQKIQEANQDLAAALTQVTEERDRTSKEKERAEHNFKQALNAVDTLLVKVGSERLSNIPRMDEVKREILESALEIQLELLGQQRGDPGLRLDTARSHGRVGDIQLELGRLEQALASQQQSVGLVQELFDGPDGHQYLGDLVAAEARLGAVFYRLGRGKSTIDAYTRACDLCESLDPADPQYDSTRHQYAPVLYDLGIIFKRVGRIEDARRSLDRSLEIERSLERPDDYKSVNSVLLGLVGLAGIELAARDPLAALARFDEARERAEILEAHCADDPGIMNVIGKVWGDRGNILATMDRSAEAAPDLAHSLAIYDRLHADYPGVAFYRLQRAVAISGLLEVAASEGDLEQALERCEQVIGILSEIAGESPDSVDAFGNLAEFQERRGQLLIELGRNGDATPAFEQAAASFEKAIELGPEYPTFRERLGKAQHELAWAVELAGDAARAESLLQELLDRTASEDLLTAARILAHRATAGQSEPAPALETLRRALAAGLEPSQILEADDCAELRALPGFEAAMGP